MMEYMTITEQTDQSEWEKMGISLNKAEFIQSWQWGEFQKATGKTCLRLQLKNKDQITAQIQGFVHKIGPGLQYLYIPRVSNCTPEVLEQLQTYAKKKKMTFIRIEPVDAIIDKKAIPTKNRQPQDTLVLNLAPTEDELLANMHKKTRYNIRVAQKHGVTIKQEKNINAFWKLNQQTTARDKFTSHDKIYYQTMLENPNIEQFTAYSIQTPIASNLCVSSGNTYTYLHGASANEHRNTMAPYLLQWHQIQQAKQAGYKYYDFWGIAPEPKNNEPEATSHNLTWLATHSQTGITRFKAGFNGTRKHYPDAVEIITHPTKYKLFTTIKNVRNYLRK